MPTDRFTHRAGVTPQVTQETTQGESCHYSQPSCPWYTYPLVQFQNTQQSCERILIIQQAGVINTRWDPCSQGNLYTLQGDAGRRVRGGFAQTCKVEGSSARYNRGCVTRYENVLSTRLLFYTGFAFTLNILQMQAQILQRKVPRQK